MSLAQTYIGRALEAYKKTFEGQQDALPLDDATRVRLDRGLAQFEQRVVLDPFGMAHGGGMVGWLLGNNRAAA